ncbi:hypothetical protein L195_g062018, partial [Trifolium pratense]
MRGDLGLAVWSFVSTLKSLRRCLEMIISVLLVGTSFSRFGVFFRWCKVKIRRLLVGTMALQNYIDFPTNSANPYYLHPNENPALVLVSPSLTAKN